MRNKEDELFKFIKEWENKDYDEFNRNFEAFVEKLELSYEETKEISLSLDAPIALRAKCKAEVPFMQLIACFAFVKFLISSSNFFINLPPATQPSLIVDEDALISSLDKFGKLRFII